MRSDLPLRHRSAFPAAKAVAFCVLVASTMSTASCEKVQPDIAVVPANLKIDTSRFDGQYQLVLEASFPEIRADMNLSNSAKDTTIKIMTTMYDNMTIENAVIRVGTMPVQEFSLQSATVTESKINGVAQWHEDIHDPGDMSQVHLELEWIGDQLHLRIGSETGMNSSQTTVYIARGRT